MVALFTEVMCYSALIAYQARKSYDLSTWADVLVCCGQDFILLGLVATLQGHSKKKVFAGGTLMLGCIAMLYNEQLVPITFLARWQVRLHSRVGLHVLRSIDASLNATCIVQAGHWLSRCILL